MGVNKSLGNVNEEKQSLIRHPKKLLYLMLALIYFSFLCDQIALSDRLLKINWSLHTSELLAVPGTISIFCVPILFLFYIYFFIKYIRKNGVRKPNIKTLLISTIVIATLVFIFVVINYQSHEVDTGGIFKVEKKIQQNSKYYIVLNGKKISVSRNEFYLVDVNKEYMADFVWNSKVPNNGRLITIEPIKK